MDRAFEFQPLFPLLCDGDWSLGLHSLQRFRVLPSYAYHTLRQYENVVGTCKRIISYICDSIYSCWEGRIAPIF